MPNKINGKKKCENEKTILMQFVIQNNRPTIVLQVFHRYQNCGYKLLITVAPQYEHLSPG